MSSHETPTDLAELAHLARHPFHAPHFGLVAGLERRIEALARRLDVPTSALASHMLLHAVRMHEEAADLYDGAVAASEREAEAVAS